MSRLQAMTAGDLPVRGSCGRVLFAGAQPAAAGPETHVGGPGEVAERRPSGCRQVWPTFPAFAACPLTAAGRSRDTEAEAFR